MNLPERAALDNKLMGVLKVNEIRHHVAETDKGTLTLMLRKGGTELDYRFVLDSVPFDEKTSRDLLRFYEGILYEAGINGTIEPNVNPTTEESGSGDSEELQEEETAQ